jgi:hypothetical protein
LLPGVRSLSLTELIIEDIDMGVPLTDIMAEFELDESTQGPLPSLGVNAVSLSVFDGSISGRGLKIDLNADQYMFPLRLKGLNLESIIELQQLDGLSASGRLDGLLPITLTKEGVRVEQGRIIAQAPGGRIKYVPEEDVKPGRASSSGAELLLRILEDLTYDSMEVEVDYEDNGEMEMQLAIKGVSPQVDAQRPVHFNMNLQQNVLTLLRGLRYVDGISEDIENSVQEYFKNQ